MKQRLLDLFPPDEVQVVIRLADEAEMDEMWAYVGKQLDADA